MIVPHLNRCLGGVLLAKPTKFAATRPVHTAPDPGAAQPRIWVEGRQQARFDVKAFASVSTTLTRRTLGPLLNRASVRVMAFGLRVEQGDLRPDLAWMGRAARAVPSHQAVGRALAGLGACLTQAAAIALPTPIQNDTTYRDLIQPMRVVQSDTGRLAKPVSTRKKPQSDETTLRAIRAMMLEPDPLPEVPRARGKATQAGQPKPAMAKASRLAGHALTTVLAQMIGWAMLVAVYPYGAGKAVFVHLNGGDLANWD